MPERIIEMIHRMQLEETTFGKVLMGFDTVGVTLSICFYGLNLGEFINDIFPPVILVLTAVSLLTSIIYKAGFEYRSYKKRRKEKTNG